MITMYSCNLLSNLFVVSGDQVDLTFHISLCGPFWEHFMAMLKQINLSGTINQGHVRMNYLRKGHCGRKSVWTDLEVVMTYASVFNTYDLLNLTNKNVQIVTC